MLISRIQAADASIPSDLGRDVSTVQALQRKHQVRALLFTDYLSIICCHMFTVQGKVHEPKLLTYHFTEVGHVM